MRYREFARRCRETLIDASWQARVLVRGYGRADYLNFLRDRGFRFKNVKVNDYRMRIDLSDNIIAPHLFLHGHWEPYESQLMGRLLRPGMTFVDVGAHIGYYSLLAARAVGPAGRVVAFEPSPDNFALLAENVRLNGFSKIVRAENMALGAERGEANLHLATYNTGDHRLYSTLPDDDDLFNAGGHRRSVRVPVIALDEYLSREGGTRVDVVKIDVQGAEMGALTGMRQTLARSERVILFTEFWPHGLLRFGTEPRAVLDFLTGEMGLSLFQILSEERRVVPIEPASFASRTRRADPLEQIDLLGYRQPDPELTELIGL